VSSAELEYEIRYRPEARGPSPWACYCLRCGHMWVKRIYGRPKRCPWCKHEWDVPVGMRKLGRPKKTEVRAKGGEEPMSGEPWLQRWLKSYT